MKHMQKLGNQKTLKVLLILVCLILLTKTHCFSSASPDESAFEQEGLKEAYKYEQEAKSYNNPKSILNYQQEAIELGSKSHKRVNTYAREAYKLHGKSFKQLECGKNEKLLNEINPDILENMKNIGDDYHLRKLVFISLSQNKTNLENIIKSAKQYGFTPVIRGFKDGNYVATVKFLNEIIIKTGYWVEIDPESFKEFEIKLVPSFVVAGPRNKCLENQSCSPTKFNKVVGNVSFDYVVRLFENSGDKL